MDARHANLRKVALFSVGGNMKCQVRRFLSCLCGSQLLMDVYVLFPVKWLR
jgi:hypothetical protein